MKPHSPRLQRVLITGASGFVGSHLAAHLVRSGYLVAALTRDKAHCRSRLGVDVETLAWDETLSRRSFDAVINLTGARIAPTPWTEERRQVLRRSRISLTEHLVRSLAATASTPEVWIQASAVGFYGMSRADDEMTEANPPGDDFAARLCADWEEAAKPIVGHGAKLSILRMGLVLGNGGALPGLLLPIRLGLGGPLGNGSQPFPWIHIDDVVKLVVACLEESRIGIVNAVAPEQHTQASFARAACEILGRPFWFPTPALPLRMLGEVSGLFLEGRQIKPRRLLNEGWTWHHPTLKSALTNLIGTSDATT